jgi:hypothetical protein
MYPAGTKLCNLLADDETITVGTNGLMPQISLPGTSAKVFVAEDQIRPLDPVVTMISPRHDAGEISPATPIQVHFSMPMDTKSVEHAFSTSPPVDGAFSWSSAHDVLTFTPAGRSFPAGSLVTVRVGDGAHDAIAGRTFYAGFESRYHCRSR